MQQPKTIVASFHDTEIDANIVAKAPPRAYYRLGKPSKLPTLANIEAPMPWTVGLGYIAAVIVLSAVCAVSVISWAAQ